MRYDGFVLPLVLAVLIAISISSLQIYSSQKQHFENYFTTDEKIDFLNTIKKLKTESISYDSSPWQNIVKTDIPLSGLFNLINLVNNSVMGKRSINNEQLLIFSKIIRGCNLPASYTEQILSFLLSQSNINNNFSMIDLFAFLEVQENTIVDTLVCFRISSRSSRINIKFSNATQIAAYLDLPIGEAITIKGLIMEGQISKKSELLAYLSKKESIDTLKKRHRNIMISDQVDHAATYWTFENNTFAYFEKDFSVENGWSVFSDTVLWLPELR